MFILTKLLCFCVFLADSDTGQLRDQNLENRMSRFYLVNTEAQNVLFASPKNL